MREGETIEGSRAMRNRPYPVLKCSHRRAHKTEVFFDSALSCANVHARAGACTTGAGVQCTRQR